MACRVVLICALFCAFAANLAQSVSPLNRKQILQTQVASSEESEEEAIPCHFVQKYNKALREIKSLKMNLKLLKQKQCLMNGKYTDEESTNNEDSAKVISGLKNSLSTVNKVLDECKASRARDKITHNQDVKGLENLIAVTKNKVVSQERDLKSCNDLRQSEKNKCNTDLKSLNQRLTDSGNKLNFQINELKKCSTLRGTEKTNCDYKINQLTKSCIKPGQFLNMVKLATGTYHFSKDMKMNWNSAKDFCLKNGLRLLSIENAAENKAVIDYIIKLGFPRYDKYFMSGTDQGQEGKWYWASTGKPFTYTAWLPPNPNKIKPPQQCATIWNNGGINWDNDYCNINAKFICELP